MGRLSEVTTLVSVVCNMFSWNPSKFKFHFRFVVSAQNLQGIEPFWLLNLVSVAKVAEHQSHIFQTWKASLLLRTATAADLESPCVCACPSLPSQLCRSAPPRVWPLILQSNLSIALWNSLREWLPDDLQGLEFGLGLELCRLTSQL